MYLNEYVLPIVGLKPVWLIMDFVLNIYLIYNEARGECNYSFVSQELSCEFAVGSFQDHFFLDLEKLMFSICIIFKNRVIEIVSVISFFHYYYYYYYS